MTVAIGDVNGDGVGDIITGTGGGGGPRVVVVDAEGNVLRDFFAYEPGFRGGVNVAAADVNDDGFDDVAVGTGKGGGPRVVVFDGKTGEELIRNFSHWTASFRDGVNVTGGDVDGDGTDLVAGTSKGGARRVRAFDGATGGVLR